MIFFNYSSNLEYFLGLISSFLLLNLMFQVGRFFFDKIVGINKYDDITKGILNIILGYFIISLSTQYLLVFDQFDLIKPIILSSSITSFFFIKKFKTFLLVFWQTLINNNFIIVISLALFFIIGFSPINDADSLGYHLFIPQQIIENSGLIYRYDDFQFGFFGLGESFILISQLFKAEIVIHWLQFISLILIFHSLIGINNLNKNRLLSMIFYSIPCLIFLVFSAKPQILIISLSLFLFKEIIEKKTINIIHILFIAFLFSVKTNYLVSSIILSILIIYNYKNSFKKVFYLFPLGVLFFLIISFPFIFYKLNYGFNLNLNFFNPVPEFIVGGKDFLKFILNYRDTNGLMFPLDVFITNSIGNISTTLGLPVVFLFASFFNKTHLISNWFYYLFIFIYTLLITFFLQSTARFFIEPLFWFLVLNKKNLMTIKFNLLQKITINSFYIIQVIGLIYLSIISLWSFSSVENRKNVLSNTAYGYNLSAKVNSIINKDKGVLIDHRTKTFLNNKNIFGDAFISYKWEKNEIMNNIEVDKIDYMIVNDNNLNDYIKYSLFVSEGPFLYKEVSRNPFNYGNLKKFWILKFDKKLICL